MNGGGKTHHYTNTGTLSCIPFISSPSKIFPESLLKKDPGLAPHAWPPPVMSSPVSCGRWNWIITTKNVLHLRIQSRMDGQQRFNNSAFSWGVDGRNLSRGGPWFSTRLLWTLKTYIEEPFSIFTHFNNSQCQKQSEKLVGRVYVYQQLFDHRKITPHPRVCGSVPGDSHSLYHCRAGLNFFRGNFRDNSVFNDLRLYLFLS